MSWEEALGDAVLGSFGESITRWPLGVEANAAAVTAIVHWHKTDGPGQAATGRRVRNTDGEAEVSTCTIEIDAGQAWDDRDVWVLTAGGESRYCETVRELGADAGTRTLLLERTKEIYTRRGRR